VLNQTLMGAIAFGSAVAGLFFFRFWRRSGDRFFVFFALAFWLEAVNRCVLALLPSTSELAPVVYLSRVVAYGLILWAIVQKNRPRR
jgi:hypothetical protein